MLTLQQFLQHCYTQFPAVITSTAVVSVLWVVSLWRGRHTSRVEYAKPCKHKWLLIEKRTWASGNDCATRTCHKCFAAQRAIIRDNRRISPWVDADSFNRARDVAEEHAVPSRIEEARKKRAHQVLDSSRIEEGKAMSAHDPHDGLTDAEIAFLLDIERAERAWYETSFAANWVRRLARENAALKAELKEYRTTEETGMSQDERNWVG